MFDEEPEAQEPTPDITIGTAAPVPIERRRLEDDPDLAPNAAIVGSYLEGRLIARCVADPSWSPDDDRGLFDEPRHVLYRGREMEDHTLRAEVLALIPAADLPREPWQPEPDEDAPPGALLLGVVVRLAADRKEEDLHREYLSHFMAILGGSAEPVVDRILKNL